MPEISAAQVQALRAKTDLPLMDCKKALIEANGSEEAAIDILRKKFADKMSSRADKEAANGRIGAYVDARGGALVEMRCETDFVAGNSVYIELANSFARQVAATHQKEPAAILDSQADFAGGRTMKQLMADAFGKLNENMEFRRGKCIHGACSSYIHHNGKVGAIVSMDKSNDEIGRQICMHVASRQLLLGLDRSAVDRKLVAEAETAVREEINADPKNASKPANILDKMFAGKMDRWYGERVLLEQPFALDDKKTVGQAAKEAGVTVTGYLRFELGEKL